MLEIIEKALTIMLLATGIKLVGEKEKVEKRKKRSLLMKPQLNRLRTSAYQNIFKELPLKDKEEFRRYLRMITETYQLKLFICLFVY